jgi:hypothetical protein
MLHQSFLPIAPGLLWALACSGVVDAPAASDRGTSGPDDASLTFPSGLDVGPHASGCSALHMTALTLQRGSKGPELYAALKNESDAPACSPAFSVRLFDRSEQFLAAGLSGLLVRRFYRLTDGSDTLAACVGPGDVTMVIIDDLPSTLQIEDVGRLEYWCNFWALELAPLGELSIRDVQPVRRGSGVAYEGRLENGLDVALGTPSVVVFQLNRVGRPLGAAVAAGTLEVPASAYWDFETNVVSDLGVERAAYPAHGP